MRWILRLDRRRQWGGDGCQYGSGACGHGKIIRELPRDAYIVDIASGEGGTDFACAREYGIHADHVLGIPGKYAPKESAYILERSLERFIEVSETENRGEMSDGFSKYNIGFGITGFFVPLQRREKK